MLEDDIAYGILTLPKDTLSFYCGYDSITGERYVQDFFQAPNETVGFLRSHKKHTKNRILIDIDDTIIDLLPTWVEVLNKKAFTNVKYEDIEAWDITKYFPTLTREQIFEPLQTYNFWINVKPKADAVEYVKKLFDEGYELYLCTSTDYRNVKAKYECVIMKYFPYLKWENVIVAHNKSMLKADFLIDDAVHNLQKGDFCKILMTAPHNKKYDAKSNGIIRADDWRIVYEIVHSKETL